MIVVLARMRAKPGQREKIVEAARACVEATRREDGCIGYELMASTESAEELLFVERWDDMEVLRRHQRTPHLARFKEAREPLLAGPSEVAVFEATAQG